MILKKYLSLSAGILLFLTMNFMTISFADEVKDVAVSNIESVENIEDTAKNNSNNEVRSITRAEKIYEKFIELKNLRIKFKKNEPVPIIHKVLVNNKSHNLNGYMINNINYFRIRDVAIAFKDSKTPFDIIYDVKTKAILIKTNKVYSGDVHKLVNSSNIRKINISESKLRLVIDDTQYNQTKVYIIDGHSYFSIDDMTKLFKLDAK